MLRAFADGADTESALRKASGSGLANLQAAFDARLEQRYGALGKALRAPEGVAIRGGGAPAEWQALAARSRGSYRVQMAAGDGLAAAGAREPAIAAYERAAALVPIAVGPNSPRARIAELAARGGDFPRALRELSSLVAADHTNIEAARQLTQVAKRLGDAAAMALAYQRIVVIDPFDSAAHSALGRIAVDRRDAALATREFRAALAAGPVDPAPAHCDLSEALLLGGQKAEAKKEVLAALEIAPTYARAQELLLKIVERKVIDGTNGISADPIQSGISPWSIGRTAGGGQNPTRAVMPNVRGAGLADETGRRQAAVGEGHRDVAGVEHVLHPRLTRTVAAAQPAAQVDQRVGVLPGAVLDRRSDTRRRTRRRPGRKHPTERPSRRELARPATRCSRA